MSLAAAASVVEMALEVRQLMRVELGSAASLLARSMRDNPVNVQAFGADAEHRELALAAFFRPVIEGARRRAVVLGAFRDGVLIGVGVTAPPRRCQPTPLEKLRILPAVLFQAPAGTAARVLQWVGEWARLDPPEAHWHLGPIAVDPTAQGQGVGGAMLRAICTLVDDDAGLAYLETDKAENVRIYERFGFAVIAERRVLGLPNWFMSRRRSRG
jgi:ribosomal protein S18 acetylase RimI-like enzyme